jgi:DNA replication protein DnaC
MDKVYVVDSLYNGNFGLSGLFKQKYTIKESLEKMKSDIKSKIKIPEQFKDASFDNYDPTQNAGHFKTLKNVVDMGFKKNGKLISMILWSKTYGVGKTHLLYSMVKSYLLSDAVFKITVDGEFVRVSYEPLKIKVIPEYTLINMVKETFKPDSEKTEGDVFKELNSFDILGIDDVVKYNPTNLDFYQRVMFQLVDERYNQNKSIIITTNKSLPELAEYIGVASADRLCEMTKDYRLEFKGKSYRGE